MIARSVFAKFVSCSGLEILAFKRRHVSSCYDKQTGVGKVLPSWDNEMYKELLLMSLVKPKDTIFLTLEWQGSPVLSCSPYSGLHVHLSYDPTY